MRILLILITLCWSATVFGQTTKLNKFYAKYKAKPNTVKMALPGWIIRFIANTGTTESEAIQQLKPLLKGLRGMRAFASEQKNYVSTTELEAVIQDAKKHYFENLVYVRNAEMNGNILFKVRHLKKKSIIKNVLILMAKEDELVMISLKGRWNSKLLKKTMKSLDIWEKSGLFRKN